LKGETKKITTTSSSRLVYRPKKKKNEMRELLEGLCSDLILREGEAGTRGSKKEGN